MKSRIHYLSFVFFLEEKKIIHANDAICVCLCDEAGLITMEAQLIWHLEPTCEHYRDVIVVFIYHYYLFVTSSK